MEVRASNPPIMRREFVQVSRLGSRGRSEGGEREDWDWGVDLCGPGLRPGGLGGSRGRPPGSSTDPLDGLIAGRWVFGGGGFVVDSTGWDGMDVLGHLRRQTGRSALALLCLAVPGSTVGVVSSLGVFWLWVRFVVVFPARW